MNLGAEIVWLVLFGFFSMNCLTCLNGNLSTSMFKISPPTINQYLPLDEELELAPVVVFEPEGTNHEDNNKDDNSSNKDKDKEEDNIHLW